MVKGLDLFISHFKGMEDNYVLIGGCACDLWMNEQNLPFRVTKDYYMLVCESKLIINGAPTLPPHCLIPLKARAYLDLKKRKKNGDAKIKDADIKKHRNDVFRLLSTMAPADHHILPGKIVPDLKEFADSLPPDSDDWESIRKSVNDKTFPGPEVSIQRIKDIFNLK